MTFNKLLAGLCLNYLFTQALLSTVQSALRKEFYINAVYLKFLFTATMSVVFSW